MITWILVGVATLVVIGQWTSVAAASRMNKHYSPIPLVSLICCSIAYFTGGEHVTLWVFLPAMLDHGNWMLPFALIYGILYLLGFVGKTPKSGDNSSLGVDSERENLAQFDSINPERGQ